MIINTDCPCCGGMGGFTISAISRRYRTPEGEPDIIAAVLLIHPEFSEADARRAWLRRARIDVNWAAVERIAAALTARSTSPSCSPPITDPH
jgi:Holliday junction resolvase-like predicted endonuclease